MIRRVVAMVVLACAIGPIARAQVKLEYKAAEGTTRRHKSVVKTHQVITVNGMDVGTDGEESGVIRSAIGTRRADGTLPVEITLESARVQMSIAGMEYTFGTDEEAPKVELPQLAFVGELFKVLKGSNYTVVLDDKYHVKFVEGVEKNLTKAADLSPQAAAAMKARFDADRIKREYEQSHGQFPDGLVREGEPWERTETNEIGGGQSLTFRRRYEYKGTVQRDGKTLDKVDVKALDVAYKQDPNAESPAKVTKSDLKVESSEGTILFDREAGNTVERKDKTRMKGGMTMTVGGMELDVKLDLTLDTTVGVEPPAK